MADTGKAGGGPAPGGKTGVTHTVRGNPQTGAPMRSPSLPTKSTGKFGG